MTNPFRRALDAESFDGSFASKIFENSLRAAEQKFYPHRSSTLWVDIKGNEVDAYTSSRVAMAVMDSASLFARSVTNPDSETTIRNGSFRDSLGFRTLGSTSNGILLGFADPKPDREDAMIDRRDSPSLAETALHTLAEVLPENDEDDQSLDAAHGLLVPQRVGLSDLSETLESINRKIELTLRVSDSANVISGQLNVEQARVLSESLSRQKQKEWIETRSGVLDGMRTRRQQFYLDTEDGHDLYGVVDERMLTQLPQFIGRHVEVTLVVSQTTRADGRTSRKAYRLTQIQPDTRHIKFPC